MVKIEAECHYHRLYLLKKENMLWMQKILILTLCVFNVLQCIVCSIDRGALMVKSYTACYFQLAKKILVDLQTSLL